jgi:ATP-dependent HslUV protease subunit HslV
LGNRIEGTTILALRSEEERKVVIAGDGQATLNNTIIKAQANKIRKLYEGQVLVGFAGATADAITLFERFEGKLKEHGGKLVRAAVELTKDWRTDRVLRRLEALLAVGSKETLLLISGSGDVMEPDDAIVSLGSGGPYALAAAKALCQATDLPLVEVARRSLLISSSIDVYTNDHIFMEELSW